MAEEPLTVEKLAEILEISQEDTFFLLNDLQQAYARERRGLQVIEVEGKFQMTTRPEYASYIEKLYKPREAALSQAALETLSIVAYKQPVTRAEMEHIRGVKLDGVLATLIARGLVQEAGRRESPGRPILYCTTYRFLHHFGLRNLEELPPLGSLDTENIPDDNRTAE